MKKRKPKSKLKSDSIPMPQSVSTAIDETERLVALKKAYAEMILNTAKEAAARVMAAERKAKTYEHDLLNTKEEAIRMLIRLKQIMEAKNTEADIASMNQQRKIQELELQLDETEGLILDLRAKLSKVQEQLDDAKSKPMHSLGEKEGVDVPTCQPCFFESESKSVVSAFHTSCWDHHFVIHQCPGPVKETSKSNSEFDNCLVDNPVFDSIYCKNKVPELYRNGYIQRIRATEISLVDEKMTQVDDPKSVVEIMSIVQKNEQLGANCSLPSMTDKLGLVEDVVKEAPFPNDNAPKDWSLKVQRLRRRRTRYGKARVRGCRYLSGQHVKSQRTLSAIARCKTYPLSSKNVEKSGDRPSNIRTRNESENGSEMERKVAFHPSHCKDDLVHAKYQTISIVRRSVRKRKIKHWDGFATSFRPEETYPCQNEEPCQKNKGIHSSAKSDDYQLEGKNEVEFEGGNVQVASANISECMKASENSGVLRVAENASKLIEVPMLVKPSLTELENVLLVPSDVKNTRMSRLTNKADGQLNSNKALTCTFSRKRKGLLINHGENYSSGERSMKRSFGEQSNIGFVPQTNCVVKESSNDRRGLVQVAHQLISLSSKRW